MTSLFKDSFVDLERHIQQLEQNVKDLQKSLNEWKLWEAEYEALKEEVTSLPSLTSKDDIETLRKGFEGLVVTEKEVDEIFGGGGRGGPKGQKAQEKPVQQVIRTIANRIDYSSQNVRTLEKQLQAAEHKLAAARIVQQPDVRDEDGQPITDIIEELDEDDNVVSYRLQTPSNTQPQVLEALGKAGINEIPEGGKDIEDVVKVDEAINASSVAQQATTSRPSELKESQEKGPMKPNLKPKPVRKGVSFTEDTKSGSDAVAAPEQRSFNARRMDGIMQAAKDHESLSLASAVIPPDESAEDAALRREMLEYSMSEIGPVVAELELEEADSDDLSEDWFEDEDDDEDDEDENGRLKYSLIDDDYRRRMMELEKKLGVKSYFTTDEVVTQFKVPDEGVGRISVAGPPSDKPTPGERPARDGTRANSQPIKKGVSFASELDIAPEEPTASTTTHKAAYTEPQVEPLSATVIERVSGHSVAPPQEPPKKTSRFRKDRSTQPATSQGPMNAPVRFLDQEQDAKIVPSGPDGQTLAKKIIERDLTPGAREPDEFDATLVHQETAAEYHRARNRMIQRAGGFVKEKEQAIIPLDEDEGGAPKRVSRFKAARLGQ